ncbi:MAG TPA: TIM barrel protein [Acidimicrobiia bacterium]
MNATQPRNARVSVSAICMFELDLAGQLEFWRRHGIRRVGISVAKLEAHPDGFDAGLALVERSVDDGTIDATNMIGLGSFVLAEPSSWPARGQRLLRAIDAAARLGAPRLVCTTGVAGALSWEEAADAWCEAMAPIASHAADLEVTLALEHTHALRADIGFVHTLRDASDLARRAGTGVCMEINACWGERGLYATIADAVDTLALVQVSDYKVGTRCTPDRLVPGDGDIPLARILAALEAAGYAGDYDLELLGPRIESEGYDSAIPRAITALNRLLS